MTNERRQQLIERLKPILDEFGVTGFTAIMSYWSAELADNDLPADCAEIVSYQHEECPSDTELMLKHYTDVLKLEFMNDCIDMVALLSKLPNEYLLSINVSEREAWEVYGMVAMALLTSGHDPTEGMLTFFAKVKNCLQKQFPKEELFEVDTILTDASQVYKEPSIERGMLQGGFEGMTAKLIERINKKLTP